MPLAVISFSFDPVVHLGDFAVRWETIAVAAAVLVAIMVAALRAGYVTSPGGEDDPPGSSRHLRRDDLLFVILGVVPGALVGGRLTDLAVHLDYYAANRQALLDPAAGGLGLSGAVVLGALTGGLMARLFDAPIGRWFHIASIPLLLVLGLGKGAMILGGTGQGIPSTTGWVTRYLGPGPWGSLGPDIPSVPAQGLEAVGVGIVLLLVVLLWGLGAFSRADGRSFFVALAGWATVRLVVAASWRDPVVVGALRVEQLIDVGIIGLAVVVVAGLSVRSWWQGRHAADPAPADA